MTQTELLLEPKSDPARGTQSARVLDALRQAGPHGVANTWFYANFIPRAAARVMELKAQGHDIHAVRVAGEFRYVLGRME